MAEAEEVEPTVRWDSCYRLSGVTWGLFPIFSFDKGDILT
jgi:hypothetical protein